MSNNKQERIIYAPIPENFAAEGTFLGYEIKLLNILQAGVLGIIPFLISYGLINKNFEIENGLSLFGVTALFGLGLAYLGFAGIDHVTPLEYLYRILKFKSRERKTFFNPRVKREKISLLAEQSEINQTLPREKVLKMYNDFLEKRNIADQQRAHLFEENELDEDTYFEEDFDVMEKPVEYMSDREFKQYKKEQKKAKKKMIKEQKKTEKEMRRNAKKKNKEKQ